MIVVLVAVYGASPISDIDFWWHIASGRWIVEHGTLPTVDPFGVFAGGNPVRLSTVLRSSWLAQVAAFLTFDKLGPGGTIALRTLLLCGAVAVVFARARACGADPAWSAFGAVFAGLTLLTLAGDRPQLFSFALVGVVFAVVDALERRWRAWLVALVAALVAAWANLHGGVILGVALVAVHSAGGAITSLREGRRREVRSLALLVLAAVFATLAAPNGITTYAYVFQVQTSELARRTSEYVGTFGIGEVAGWGTLTLAAVYYVAALVAAPALARRSLGRLAGVVAGAVASVVSYRYHLFFVLVTVPWIVAALSTTVAALPAWTGRVRALAAPGAAALAVAAMVAWRSPLAARDGAVKPGRFPVEAMRHVQELRTRGTALAWFGWSGYVLWAGYPEVRPFLDPRMLDDALLRPYTHMIWATPEGMRSFEDARFELVLLPYRSAAGERYPLHALLQARQDYRAIVRWDVGALYQRTAAE